MYANVMKNDLSHCNDWTKNFMHFRADKLRKLFFVLVYVKIVFFPKCVLYAVLLQQFRRWKAKSNGSSGSGGNYTTVATTVPAVATANNRTMSDGNGIGGDARELKPLMGAPQVADGGEGGCSGDRERETLLGNSPNRVRFLQLAEKSSSDG